MANIITSGTTAADSADFTLADGASTTIFLSKAAHGSVDIKAEAEVQIKDAGNFYHPVSRLNFRYPLYVLQGPGTFRVSRLANDVAFGVDRV